ncbi:uncharacterized protein LOC135839564 [Planococcus citri]|uniref:uncharacterized protein LOC135839564 n=1 Tax=Planococcus citri TaxID=170843 RepID=UPI0031F8AB8B
MEIYHTAIHQNLLLLTKVFPNLDMDGKLQKGMFKKPNTKGMQSVFYSIMSIINPEYCRKNVPWPVSFSSDSFKFRNAVIEFIKKECSDFEVPKLLPSLLNKADGEKYVKFVFNFTTYVTKIVIYRKFGELLLEKPNVNVNYEENLALLNNMIFMLMHEEEQNQSGYLSFKENCASRTKNLESDLIAALKTFQNKKHLLFTEDDKSSLDDAAIERLFAEIERELFQLKRHHDKLKSEVQRILKKQDYLLFLINLKKKTTTGSSAIKAVDNLAANENISKAIDVPVNVLLTNLIAKNTTLITTDYHISLKYFLHYGRLILAIHMQRFLALNLSPKHLAICRTISDISTNSAKRVDRFEALKNQLNETINTAKSEQPINLKAKNTNLTSNHCTEIVNLLKLKRSYGSQFCVPIQMKNPITHFFTETNEQSSKNSMERMKQKIQTAIALSNSERTAKLYLNF